MRRGGRVGGILDAGVGVGVDCTSGVDRRRGGRLPDVDGEGVERRGGRGVAPGVGHRAAGERHGVGAVVGGREPVRTGGQRIGRHHLVATPLGGHAGHRHRVRAARDRDVAGADAGERNPGRIAIGDRHRMRLVRRNQISGRARCARRDCVSALILNQTKLRTYGAYDDALCIHLRGSHDHDPIGKHIHRSRRPSIGIERERLVGDLGGAVSLIRVRGGYDLLLDRQDFHANPAAGRAGDDNTRVREGHRDIAAADAASRYRRRGGLRWPAGRLSLGNARAEQISDLLSAIGKNISDARSRRFGAGNGARIDGLWISPHRIRIDVDRESERLARVEIGEVEGQFPVAKLVAAVAIARDRVECPDLAVDREWLAVRAARIRRIEEYPIRKNGAAQIDADLRQIAAAAR